MALRTIPIRRVSHRANLLMGADRELLMFSGVVVATLIFAIQKWVAVGFGLVLWFGALFALRLMAKADPMMRHVYLRHRQYKSYYPARSTPFRENTKSQARRYK